MDRGLGLFQRAAGLGHVDLPDDASLEFTIGDFQGLALENDVFLGVADALRGGAIFHVVRRHVAQEGDQDVVVAEHGGVQGRGIGFHRPPEPAPEVEFPTEVETVVPLGIPPPRDERAVGSLAAVHVAGKVPRHRLRLREEVPHVDEHLRRASSTRKPAARRERFCR